MKISNENKNSTGITLIALVITILVLLILAGVSIAMLTGNNGIITQATNAKTNSAKAEAIERINMALNAAYTEAMAPPSTAPSVATIQAYDTGLTTANGYTVTAEANKVKIEYNKDGISTSGTIEIVSPFTIDPAK